MLEPEGKNVVIHNKYPNKTKVRNSNMLEPEGKNVVIHIEYPNKNIRGTKARYAIKKESTKKINQENQIDKSKQLANKKNIKRSKITRKTTGGNSRQRICGNGKPMPSLSELEKMFESSDDEDSSTSNFDNMRLSKTPIEYDPKLTERNVLPAISLQDLTTNVCDNDNVPNFPEPALLCENGKYAKAMPSLLDLERMFGDSEVDLSFNMDNIKTYKTSIECDSNRTDANVPTPITLKNLTDRMHNIISNLPDSSLPPSPPVILHNKPKKRNLPYIVGCKDRPQIIKKPKLMCFKGKEKYGIKDNIQIEQENDLKKRKKHSKILSTSKSLFNSRSNEISELLKEKEYLSDVSADSNDTITYEHSMNSPKSRPFSPLPSTSNDNETILRNDQRFNESFTCENVSGNVSQNDNKIIEMPCETITIDDKVNYENLTKDNICTVNDSSVQVNETITINDKVNYENLTKDTICTVNDSSMQLYETITIDDKVNYEDLTKANICTANDSSVQLNDSDCVFIDDSAVKIVECDQKSSVIMKSSDYCSSVNIYDTYDLTENSDVQEIIDVDEIIAENKNIIEKYCKNNNTDVIIQVEPSPLQNKRQKENTSLNNIFTKSNGLVENENAKPNSNVIPTLSQDCRDTIGLIISNFFKNGEYKVNTNNHQSGNDNISNITIQAILPTNWLSTLNCSTQERSNNSNYVHNPPTVNRTQNILDKTVSINRSIREDMITSSTSRYNKSSRKNNQVTQRKTTSMQAMTLSPPLSTETIVRNVGDCPICMENLSNKAIASTICGHIFCMPCIKAAIKSTAKRCPTCRKVLKGNGYHPLFL